MHAPAHLTLNTQTQNSNVRELIPVPAKQLPTPATLCHRGASYVVKWALRSSPAVLLTRLLVKWLQPGGFQGQAKYFDEQEYLSSEEMPEYLNDRTGVTGSLNIIWESKARD